MESYTAMKKNKLLLYAPTCMNLTDIMLSESRQTNEYLLYDSIYMKLKDRQSN